MEEQSLSLGSGGMLGGDGLIGGPDLEVGHGSQTADGEVLNQANTPSCAASRAWGHAAHIPETSFRLSDESCLSPAGKGQSLGNRSGKVLTPGLSH